MSHVEPMFCPPDDHVCQLFACLVINITDRLIPLSTIEKVNTLSYLRQTSSSLICCNSPTMHCISIQYSVLDFVKCLAHYQVIV